MKTTLHRNVPLSRNFSVALCLGAILSLSACGGTQDQLAQPEPPDATSSVEIPDGADETKLAKDAGADVKAAVEDKLPEFTYTPGKFVWFEQWSKNEKQAKRARKFYETVFGWKHVEMEMSGTRFVAIMNGQMAVGLTAVAEKSAKLKRGIWMGFISTTDVDLVAKNAEAAGAPVLMGAHEMKGVGRFAVMKDNNGAVFGAVRASQGDAPMAEPKLGEIAWMELWVKKADVDKTLDFYATTAGYTKVEMPMGKETAKMLTYNDVPYAGVSAAPSARFANSWVPFVVVSDVDETVKIARKAGAKPAQKAIDLPGIGRVATMADPTGAVIGFYTAAAKE